MNTRLQALLDAGNSEEEKEIMRLVWNYALEEAERALPNEAVWEREGKREAEAFNECRAQSITNIRALRAEGV